MLSVDKDDATQRAERDREAAAKRQQNLLPSWHLKSTISGELTALGVKEHARKDDGAPQVALPEGNRLPSLGESVVKAQARLVQAEKDSKQSVAQMVEADCESWVQVP